MLRISPPISDAPLDLAAIHAADAEQRRNLAPTTPDNREQYLARRAACEACDHRISPEQCRCGWGRCGHPSITSTTQPSPLRPDDCCPVGKWEDQQ